MNTRKSFTKVVRVFGGAVVVGGLLAVGPAVMAASSETKVTAGAEKGIKEQRSYFFSRTATPYEGYEAWLKDNPRYNHPYHDQVHGPLFSDSATNNPAVHDAKTRPYLNQPALVAERRIKPPYGYHRILWVNDRYYSGKHYPTAKEKTKAAE